jgi:threonine dehydratase
VGVVSAQANAYSRSFAVGSAVCTDTAATFADGLATRVPDTAALAIIRAGVERIVEVSDDEIAEAIRLLFTATHNCAEGAGAAALAALIKERSRMTRRVAVILSGQNIDRSWMQTVLSGDTPRVG